MSADAWQLFDIEDLRSRLSGAPVEYREFFSVPAMHCGIYYLARGSTDMQSPHDEDEVYVVIAGRARMQVGDEVKDVRPGSVLYVRATESHSFFEIDEDMTLLVFFATQQSSDSS